MPDAQRRADGQDSRRRQQQDRQRRSRRRSTPSCRAGRGRRGRSPPPPRERTPTGMTSRGKYTFLMRFADAHEAAATTGRCRAAKRVQGRSPVKEKSGYGSPSEPTLASRPKKIVKTIIVSSGWRTAHATPSNGLLVAHLDVAPDQEVQQLPVRPDVLEAERDPALERLDDHVGNRRVARNRAHRTRSVPLAASTAPRDAP